MAIDRGPWNALVDDDGSNLIGTVWNKDKIKTVILDPTDAALSAMATGAAPTMGTFTPVDISGGLGNLGSGTYWKLGLLVAVTIYIQYPANSNGADAAVGGLPFAQNAGFYGGFYEGFGPTTYRTFVVNNTNVIKIMSASTGLLQTNANLSGQYMNLHGMYFTN